MSKLNLVGLLAACICSCAFQANAREGSDMNALLTHTHIPTHILGLEPIPNSYQIAKATFLPELENSENGWSGHKTSASTNKGNNCSGYDLTSCPAHATCSSCPFDRRYKRLISCVSGYIRKGNSCKAASCQVLGYNANIPYNNICTKIFEDDLTCYKDCRTVSCSSYKVSCSNKPANATTVSQCPDCKDSSNSNCGDNVCRVDWCAANYKINGDMTGCILKDDTCPNGYYKTCATGTQGDPKYTELGSSCYQCKPAQSCNGMAYYQNMSGSYTVGSSQTSINLYGRTNTTTIPSGGVTVCRASWTYPSGATVSGGVLTINGDLILGEHGGGSSTKITFNNKVIINGRIYIHAPTTSTIRFNGGVSGSYSCYKNGWIPISCPF